MPLSCHAWICFSTGRWRGGGTKTLRLCHMCASTTRTISITHTLTPDSYACGKHIKIVFVCFLNWWLKKNREIKILISCRVECFFVVVRGAEQRVSGFNQGGKHDGH